MARYLDYLAGEKDAGRTVSDVIRNEFGLVAHDIARAKYRTENGITVNGVQVLVNRRLSAGDCLRVKLDGELPRKTVPVPGPLDILYEDEDLIAVNKPAGIVTHPSHGHFSDTLSNYLADYFLKKGEPHEIRSVGRLDKDTSGVMIFAKSRTAEAHLVREAEDGRRRKCYLALLTGIPEQVSGAVEAPISREYEEKIRRVVREDGASARTRYRVIKSYDGYSLAAVLIETGRTHQIRVHMQYIGHPLLGDPIYGDGAYVCGAGGSPDGTGTRMPGEGEYGSSLSRSALHAWKVTLEKPFSGENLELTAPVPEDLAAFIGNADLGPASEFFRAG